MTTRELHNLTRDALTPKFGTGEAAALTRILFEEVLHLDPVQTVIRGDSELPDFIPPKVDGITRRLLAGEPIQYIFGHARFCGLELKVTPDVLIPRPETEQLVDMVTDRVGDRSDLRVLDCGTGSGCIAVALARALHFPDVTAIDISRAALDVASENAHRLGVSINFSQADMLNPQSMPPGQWDAIVSNPPYVLDSEKAAMEQNVLAHEPHTALFVPDSDPLKFYNAILAYAAHSLSPDGSVLFEINPLEADRYASLAQKYGFTGAEILPDIHGRKRFAIISRK